MKVDSTSIGRHTDISVSDLVVLSSAVVIATGGAGRACAEARIMMWDVEHGWRHGQMYRDLGDYRTHALS